MSQFDPLNLCQGYGTEHTGIDFPLTQKLRQLGLVSRATLYSSSFLVQDSSSRRHADFLAFEIRYGFDRRALEHDDLSLSNLSRKHDLDRDAVGGDADGIGRGRGKSNIDRVRDDRAGRPVNLGELNPFDVEAFLFRRISFAP